MFDFSHVFYDLEKRRAPFLSGSTKNLILGCRLFKYATNCNKCLGFPKITLKFIHKSSIILQFDFLGTTFQSNSFVVTHRNIC